MNNNNNNNKVWSLTNLSTRDVASICTGLCRLRDQEKNKLQSDCVTDPLPEFVKNRMKEQIQYLDSLIHNIYKQRGLM